MKQNINIVMQAVEAYRDTILAAERYIWKHPETGYREWNTHAYLKEKYEELGYTVTEAGNIPGFWTDIDTGRPGPRIAVFGEMDSLIVPTHPECDPITGAVHACGHHCQSAALLGVAAALKTSGVPEYLSGSVRLIVVPAEELIELAYRKRLKEQGIIRYFGGKQEFMARGVLDDVDMALMVHTGSSTVFSCTSGGNGCVIKEATFMGKGAHAGGSPQNGINALYAANCGMQAANALRETFPDADHVRFHPIITQGGAAVNAIPDQVVTESYLRASSMEAMARENQKVNRAFAGAAAAMGARVHLWDHHGYAPLIQESNLRELAYQIGVEVLGEDRVAFRDTWGGGSTDMGDISCVMPALHPYMGGAQNAAHSKDYIIADPVMACVDSAKFQAAMLVRLLENDAAQAARILREGRQDYPTIREYLEQIDALCIDRQAVVYGDEHSAELIF